MKKLLILLCIPFMGFGQSFEPTPCDCVKYVVTEMKIQGLNGEEDLDKNELRVLEILEKKYNGCEKFRDRFLDESSLGKPLFKEEFVNCILDDNQLSDICKCTHLFLPAFVEGMVLAFSDDVDESIKKERESFWDRKLSFCLNKYGKIDDWSKETLKKSDQCQETLLEELLGYRTQETELFFARKDSDISKKETILFGEINDPDGYTNVRADRSGKSKILFKVYKNKRFKIVDDSGSWWLIEYNGQKGYMYNKRINIIE